MKRMMIVEDHLVFAQALLLIFRVGMEVVLARTLEEGRALIWGSDLFDVVVLDLVLPDGVGTDLIPDIRERHPQTRIAVLSARDDIGEVASEAGADVAIPKGTPLPEIISSLRRLID